MRSDHTILKLVGKIYEAASDSKLWPGTLQRLADVVRANAVALDVHDFRTGDSRLAFNVNINMEISKDFETYYAPKNPVYQRGDSLLSEGNVLTHDMVLPLDEFCRSEYYNDFLRPNGFCHLLGGAVLRRASIAAILTLTRPVQKSPFGEVERRTMRSLIPHLQNALQLQERLRELEGQRRNLSDALDLVSFGVILAAPKGRILLLNRCAARILQENDGITAGPEGLRLSDRKQSDALRALVAGVAATAGSTAMSPGAALSICRPSMRRNYSLLVCPISPCGSGPLLSDRPAAAIFITDPETHCEPPAQLLRRLYGLTTAEARLAMLVMEGKSLTEAAEDIGVTRNTAHTQLTAIFDKTGTRRQSELVRLLISGPAQVRVSG